MRQPTKKNTGGTKITPSGKNLAAVLYRIKQQDDYNLIEITRKLQTFLPHFIQVDVVDDKESNQFIIKLKDKDKKEYTSRVLSEGTLRILALCIMEFDDEHTGLLCFEEPENGVHHYRVKDMTSLLKDLSVNFSEEELPLRQVIVNTHSPILVRHIYNWKEDHNVGVWYASIRNRVANIDDKRVRLQVTNIIPVEKENLLPLGFSDSEKKLALNTIEKYLETIDNPS